MIRLFFSYSHRDEALRNELETHLSMLKRQGVIATWHDRRIDAGNQLDNEISQHLENAEIVLLLVSPDFLASDYCYDVEMTRALERQRAGEVRVIPVILRPCDWHHTSFGKLLAVPKDGKPVTKYANQDDAFLEVCQAIRAIADKPGQHEEAKTERSLAVPHPTGGPSVASVRSSNLRVRHAFSDRERDEFQEQTFEFVANFFEGSLVELERRTRGINTKFRRVDANHFTAAIYRHGMAESQCKIWLASQDDYMSGIHYSSSPSPRDNSYNESLRVTDDGYSMSLESTLGINRERLMSQEGAAEHLWEMLISPLQ